MVLSLTSMQSSRLLHFGFWILDFGLKPAFFVVRIQSKIQNPKSKMPSRLRGQCRLRTGFLYIRSSKIVRCLLFVAFVASSRVRHQGNYEPRTTNFKTQLLPLPSRLPDSNPAALVRHKLQPDFPLSARRLSVRLRIPFRFSIARSRLQTRSRDSDRA